MGAGSEGQGSSGEQEREVTLVRLPLRSSVTRSSVFEIKGVLSAAACERAQNAVNDAFDSGSSHPAARAPRATSVRSRARFSESDRPDVLRRTDDG